MNTPSDLNTYLSNGIESMLKGVLRAAGRNLGQAKYLLGFTRQAKKAAAIRQVRAGKGMNAPPFLIASIASQCNLQCAGCYDRANTRCATGDMNSAQWADVFAQAAGAGVSFILLAGGEPFTRRDVLAEAARREDMIFPVFTNGTMMDDGYADMFRGAHNLFPIFSLEGDAAATDARRGTGVSASVDAAMAKMKARGKLFGVSITVTRQNMDYVTGAAFADGLREKGCGLVFYVEYVPAQEDTAELVLTPEDIAAMDMRLDGLRKGSGMVLLSFPGDEKHMGGCLAAGRGFFHISHSGDAEPCPFSPYSNLNMRHSRIDQVLESEFFQSVRDIGAREAENHYGGCTLFEHRDEVLGNVCSGCASAGE